MVSKKKKIEIEYFKSAGEDSENTYRKFRNDKIANLSLVNTAGNKFQRTANELLN